MREGDLLRADELPEETIQVVLKSHGQIYHVYCPLAMLQVLPALVQAELFRAQLLATPRQAQGADDDAK